MLRTLVAGATMAAAVTAMAVGPAAADPVTASGKVVKPAVFDFVGVGSDTTQDVTNQLSLDYNSSHARHNNSNPHIYSWDATNPKTQATGDKITTKTGCAKIDRPNGGSAGITELQLNTVDPKSKSHFCVDFARTASARSTQPTGKGGVLFVALAQDAVSYATQQNTNAPASLTTGQLTKIYSCAVTTWNQIGGKSHAKIQPYLPPLTSALRAFFQKVINVATPGPCVNKLGTPEQNEGTSKLLKTANAIFPYSIGDYVSQRFHSAKCGKKPAATQNKFGCDLHGTLKLNSVNGKKPTIGSKANTTINPKFSAPFIHTLYNVVRWSTATKDHVPSRLEPFFGRHGYFCTSKAAKQAVRDYGFLPSALCGLGF